MKFSKLIAGIAAASMAASVCAFSASALEVQGSTTDAEGKDLVIVSEAMWLAIPYNNGERNASVLADKNKAVIDYGIDWTQAGSIEVVMHVTPDTYEDFDEENNFGGAIVLGSNADGDSSHNWNAKEWYGVNDEDLEFTAETAKDLQANKVGDHQYKVVCPVDSMNSVVANAQMVQVAIQHYNPNSVWYSIAVDSVKVLDKSGSLLIGWDGATGAVELGASAAPAVVTEAPVVEVAVEETVVEEAAPVETAQVDAAAETAAAPVAGDVTAVATTTKGSPNTGIEDVAVVAGIGLAAAGAFLIAKKRK
ncbi:MAG: hypothetical protein IK093_17810 [Ruminiclostridium sp.]|nr:hypothetical protein [Ruminiclostridium sp.]